MVALKQLFDSPSVDFVAGRNFLLFGVQYKVGDTIDATLLKGVKNRESLIRSRRAIPTATDLNDVPRAFRKEIKKRDLLFRQLKREDPSSSQSNDVYGTSVPGKPYGSYVVSTTSVANAKAGLSEPDNKLISRWAYAYLDETSNGARPTLLSFIEAGYVIDYGEGVTETVTFAQIEAYIDDPTHYGQTGVLREFPAPA